MSACVFCEIVAGHADAEIVDEGRYTMVFKPLNPVTPGHVLVISKEHVSDAAEDPRTTALVMEAAAILAADMEACNIVTSKGEAATQSVFHLHVHVIPRRFGDGLKLPWTDQRPSTSASVGPEASSPRKGDGPVSSETGFRASSGPAEGQVDGSADRCGCGHLRRDHDASGNCCGRLTPAIGTDSHYSFGCRCKRFSMEGDDDESPGMILDLGSGTPVERVERDYRRPADGPGTDWRAILEPFRDRGLQLLAAADLLLRDADDGALLEGPGLATLRKYAARMHELTAVPDAGTERGLSHPPTSEDRAEGCACEVISSPFGHDSDCPVWGVAGSGYQVAVDDVPDGDLIDAGREIAALLTATDEFQGPADSDAVRHALDRWQRLADSAGDSRDV